MPPIISIVIPVFNAAEHVAKCLNTVLSNEQGLFEIIVVNDGSTDGSDLILDEFVSRNPALFRMVHLAENRGVSFARNAGICSARGEYILFVDADDQLHPGAISCLCNCVTQTKADIVIFQYQKVNEGGMVLSSPCIQNQELYDLTCPSSFRAAFNKVFGNLIACNGLYNKKMLNGLRFSGYPNGEDVLFGVQALVSARSLAICPSVLYDYIQRKGSASQSKTKKHFFSMIDVVCELYKTVRLSPHYYVVKDVLFRKIRGITHGQALGLLNMIPLSERNDCENYWFNQLLPVYCGNDLVPRSQKWLYLLIFHFRRRTLVWLAFRLPIRAKALALECSLFRRAWLRLRTVMA